MYAYNYAPTYPSPYPSSPYPYGYAYPSAPTAPSASARTSSSETPPLDDSESLPFFTSGDVPVDPTCANFPGLVPNSNRLDYSGSNKIVYTLKPLKGSETIYTQWLSTGFYAVPGKQVKMTLVPKISDQSKKEDFLAECVLQIGCHSDTLHHLELSELKRPPVILIRCNLDESGKAALANPFGGLIYLEIPVIDLDSKKGQLHLTLTLYGGRVRAPYFKVGKTSLRAWVNRIRYEPAPFAELESKKIIISIPSSGVRGLKNPAEVLRFWDGVLDAMRDLLGKARERDQPERFCADIQISDGYMHSGYPVMACLDAVEEILDFDTMRKKGNWGFFHEFGHNHQDSSWTFEAATEVTVNLFSMYIHEVHLKIPLTKSDHGENFFPEGLRKHAEDYISKDKDFEKVWSETPDLALVVYYQLVMRFSWNAYKAVFAAYNKMDSRMNPKTDQDKIDLWIYMFSETVKENLVDFFRSWNFPISTNANGTRIEMKSGEMMLNINPTFPSCPMRMEDLLKLEGRGELTGTGALALAPGFGVGSESEPAAKCCSFLTRSRAYE